MHKPWRRTTAPAFRIVVALRPVKMPPMTAVLPQPVPENLREQLIKRLQSASETDLVFAHELMLFAEKDRLWKQIQEEAAQEAAAGLHEGVPELIRQYRDRNKRPA